MSDKLNHLAAIREDAGRRYHAYLDAAILGYSVSYKIVLTKDEHGEWHGVPQEPNIPEGIRLVLEEYKKAYFQAIADYENEKRRQYELFTNSQLSVPWNQ